MYLSCVLALGSSACANVVFDNGDPNFGYGVTILSELDSLNQVGDDFTLEKPAKLKDIEWWGDGEGENFRMRIFEVADGIPAPKPLHDIDLGAVAGTPDTSFGSEQLFYTAKLSNISLDAGDYLLSIVDYTETQPWYWSVSCEDGCEGESFRRSTDGAPWGIGNYEMAFRLRGMFKK